MLTAISIVITYLMNYYYYYLLLFIIINLLYSIGLF